MLASDALFGNKVMKKTLQGTYAPVPAEHFAGVSVALYFAKLRHPKCARIFPSLKQFYLTTNASNERPSVEIVYVSLDEDRETFERARSMMPWCSVEYDSDVRRNLINRYQVTDEEMSWGTTRKLPSFKLPQLIVIGPHGQQAGRLDLDQPEETFIHHWDYRHNKWPGEARPRSATAARGWENQVALGPR
ncbi:pdi family protein [Cystoisospora suis]|uniref:protein-disulfide reductase n=1 Tax=Cystoisospora suis TaxID=483139 RepID=A0A2C6KJC7_9APIC|nr:pdi family protein [Cystoisospora suis]